MRNIVASLAALMSASLFVQLSNSAMTTLIALKLAAGGQTESDVGIISAAYAATNRSPAYFSHRGYKL